MSFENEAHWYVVHTYSGYENRVAANIEKIVDSRNLSRLILETKIPTEVIVDSEEDAKAYLEKKNSEEDKENDQQDDESKSNEHKEKKPEERKLFPSYVLIRMVMNDETWHVIRNIRGVTGFVGPGSKPVPLSDEEILALGVDLRVRKVNFDVGDSVMVVAGLLAGSIVTVKEINHETRRVKVLAMFGGKESVIEMDTEEVEPLSN